MNKFEQLEQDLVDGTLSIRQVTIAIRSSIRRRKDLPDGIKDLLSGKSANDSGLLSRFFNLILQIVGTVELAYRRGGDLPNKVDALDLHHEGFICGRCKTSYDNWEDTARCCEGK